jgi:cAMP-specific phosphodiesterase 4
VVGLRAACAQVEALLAGHADEWHFDMFRLADASGGAPLAVLGFYLMSRTGLLGRFRIGSRLMARFLGRLEAGYAPNPYHNSTHAADVLHTCHVLLHRSGMVPLYADPLGLLAAYLAAVSARTHRRTHAARAKPAVLVLAGARPS